MLDVVDKAILGILQVNGRASYREIGRMLELPESTVRSRTQKLLDGGALSVVVVGNPLELGISILALCLVKVDSARAKEVAEILVEMPAIRYVAISLGGTTIIIESLHRDQMDFHTFLAEGVPGIEGVQQIESYQIIEVCKSVWDWSTWLADSDPGAVEATS
jgi:Lrp/AsnC family transcriptional regulator, regulator for asnA, asnC and gidA